MAKKISWIRKNDKLINRDTKEEIELNCNNKYTLATPPVRKGALSTIGNSIANALSGSYGNGYEKVNVVLHIENDEEQQDLILNKKVLVKNSLDYHAIIREGRALVNDLKKIQF